MKKVVICIISYFLGSIVFGGTIDPQNKDNQHIEYAQDFKCVYKICGNYNDGSGTFFFASAVAIEPEWVLTAAHVVKNAKSGYITQGDGHKYTIKKFIHHKDFKENQFGYYDIALCQLETKLPLDFYPELYSENNEIGQVCSISGFGDTGNFTTGVSISDGKKRAGSNIIDQVDRHLLICTPSRVSKKTQLEFIIANGDSGGGLFITNKLAGINSCVISSDKKTDSSYGDEGGHTRISVFKEWIHKTIATEGK
jgi:hypothetical protein